MAKQQTKIVTTKQPPVRPSHGRELVGEVVSTKMQKTIIVSVTRVARHPFYKKPVRQTRRLPAHVEGIEVAPGDRVRIVETRPISKTKHFVVVERLNV